MADTQMNVFKTILTYSVFIILAPITTFFATKVFFFHGVFGSESVTSNVWSAVAAVIVLHVGLGAYIYKAYSESAKVKSDKDDKID